MDADGNKGAVPGRSCNRMCACAVHLFIDFACMYFYFNLN